MRAFADLLDRLATAPSRNAKLRLMQDYFRATPDPDRGWALSGLTDGLPFSFPLRRTLSDMMARRMDPELFRMSRDYVGDTAETIALVWEPRSSQRSLPPCGERDGVGGMAGHLPSGFPPPLTPPRQRRMPHGGRGTVARGGRSPRLADIVSELALIGRNDLGPRLETWLDALDATGRWALLKLLTGALRVGVSARLAKTAVAEMAGFKVGDVEEVWHGLAPPYEPLFAWLEGRGPKPDVAGAPVFRPLMLSHPLEDADWAGLDLAEFSAEWKWDGIRVQIVAGRGETRLYSRTGDDIGHAFPDVVSGCNFDAVLDGELLVVRKGVVAPFNDLQQRLNRKGVSQEAAGAVPRPRSPVRCTHRRGRRSARAPLYGAPRGPGSVARQDAPSAHRSVADHRGRREGRVAAAWSATRETSIEGVMLKRRDSPYVAGRPKGQWYKWKRAPLTLDCVLMYAQRGSGKRSSYYSDYTFGAWRDGRERRRELVPVGKAYFGFTDEELLQIDRWVRNHTTESFGPVRAVAPGAGIRSRLRRRAEIDASQVGRRHALPAHPSHPLGQAGGGGRPAGNAGGDDRG